jgi:hypothetical protein
VVHFPLVDARREIQPLLTREVDQSSVEEATRGWRHSSKYLGEGNRRFFAYALSLRSAGMPLADIEPKLREEAKYGRSPDKRGAQVQSIMKSLREGYKKSA